MSKACIFCDILDGKEAASFVRQDALTAAFMDLRQFHAGHVLVVPRAHLADLRELDAATGAALMSALADVARAVSTLFQCPGASVWHSIGEAAGQEVPHLHFHVHPRFASDGLLQVYPVAPRSPDRATLDRLAATLRSHLLPMTQPGAGPGPASLDDKGSGA